MYIQKIFSFESMGRVLKFTDVPQIHLAHGTALRAKPLKGYRGKKWV